LARAETLASAWCSRTASASARPARSKKPFVLGARGPTSHGDAGRGCNVALSRSSDVSEREFFIDNLLVRVHLIIEMIRWTGLAPWEFEFPFSGSLISTFLRPAISHSSTGHTAEYDPFIKSQLASRQSTLAPSRIGQQVMPLSAGDREAVPGMEREFFIDKLLVRIYVIIVMIR